MKRRRAPAPRRPEPPARAAPPLSGTRDADVRVATATALAEHAAGRLPGDVFDALRDALVAEAAGGQGDATAAFAGLIEALRAAELRVEAWPLERADWKTVLAGVTRAF